MPSMSLLHFIGHIAKAVAEEKEHENKALEKAAKLVEREAKRELGKYQDGAGPFGAWPELADRTQDDRVHKGFTANDPGRRSGEMADGIGHEVGDREAVVGSNDDEMVYFELGTEKQPPRSVLGMALVHKAPAVARILGEGVVQALVGKGVFLGRMGID
jgi:hypothetical protein